MSFQKFAPRVKQYTGITAGVPAQAYGRAAAPREIRTQPISKAAPIRSESYRRFVASHPCFDCGVSGWSQCAHENLGKGMALKVCDLRSWPLCGPRYGLIGCHQQFDMGIERSRQERRALGAQWVERMQGLARAAHRAEFDE